MHPSIKNKTGLTLIEVLVALAILSIALTAIIKCASQNIRNLMYLENRTIATWVANNVINQVRAGVIRLPEAPSHADQETQMLGQTWNWQASLDLTPNKNIKEIAVNVMLGDAQLAHLTGFLYVSQQ